jgi:hypothetical protein
MTRALLLPRCSTSCAASFVIAQASRYCVLPAVAGTTLARTAQCCAPRCRSNKRQACAVQGHFNAPAKRLAQSTAGHTPIGERTDSCARKSRSS